MSSRISPRFSLKLGPKIGFGPACRLWRICLLGSIVGAFSLPIVLPSSASGQSIDPAVLNRVKDSTVYIKIKAGKVQGSGSGFVFKNLNGTVLIMTNRHVAVPDADEIGPGEKAQLSVVFRSGTPQEQELPATLLGYDHREIADLAVLQVKGVTSIPEPILADLAVAEGELHETMPAFALGFPLGAMIQQVSGNVKQNPAITVNPLTISSLRRDENNMLARIQLAGSIIGGNSGGPVVDAKGRLVGVVVSRLVNENVGFAIPPFVIKKFLEGSVGDLILFEVVGSIGPDTKIKFIGELVDPLGRLKGMGIRYTTQPVTPEQLRPVPGSRTGYPELPGGTTIKMMREGDRVSTTFPVPIRTAAERKIHIQFLRYDYGGNVDYVSKAFPVMIDHVGPYVDVEAESKPPMEVKWSCLSNLGEGIKIIAKPDVTSITTPGNVPLNNAPQYDLFNAPCALVKVNGDFVTAVVVNRTLDPGSEGVTVPNGTKPLNFSFQSAGLLLWQDEKNFIRFERAKKSEGGLMGMKSQLLVEVYKKGKAELTYYLDIPDVPVALVAIRQGASVHLYFEFPPNKRVLFREMTVDFKDDMFVGVAAANLSKRPFTAKFQEFALFDLQKNPIEAKPLKMEKLVEPPSVKMPDGTIVYEGAAMRGMGKAADQVASQNMAEVKGSWSGNRQLLWNNDKPDGLLQIELPVAADGNYEIKGKFTRASDYAIVKLDLDGKPLAKGLKYDFYAAEPTTTDMSLATLKLVKGKHKLSIQVFKNNPKSSGYHFGIDEIRLIPTK